MGLNYVGTGILDAGTVTSPSLRFSDEPGTGLYRVGSDGIGVTVSGVNVGTLASTGSIFKGTTTNDSAASGFVGQELLTNLPTASAVSLTTGTAATVITQSVTAGDYELDGCVVFKPGATTSITVWAAAISATTNAVPAIIGQPAANEVLIQKAAAAFVPGANDICIPIPNMRISLASTTNVFLVAKSTFTVSTLAAYGSIRLRRIR